MCGIAGLFSLSSDHSFVSASLQSMISTLHRRGPDAVGYWVDSSIPLGLAHSRLSIRDLSAAGSQPMHSLCGRYVLSFNGEIYNSNSLKQELSAQGYNTWRGTSDTEVLLVALSVWGITASLRKCEGMFAFALWDKQQKKLTLCRDRLGEKPLYYGFVQNCFVFCSELKAIAESFSPALAVNEEALAYMLRYGYVPSPYSIYDGIHKLPSGSYISIDSSFVLSKPSSWWSFSNCLSNRLQSPYESDVHYLDSLSDHLTNAVSLCMESDVPIGCLLSGGIDSSLIASTMQSVSSSPINTFTVGFENLAYDESRHASRVAKYLGTNHTEITVTESDALNLIPTLPDVYDEPFGDSSQIPTTLVSSLVSSNVRVCLSGDGGDELFGGYNRYMWAPFMWNKFSNLPLFLRRILSQLFLSIKSQRWSKVYSGLNKFMPFLPLVNTPGYKLHKLAQVLSANSPLQLYDFLISQSQYSHLLFKQPIALESIASLYSFDDLSFVENMMAIDTLTYLQDDILVKVDRASMSNGLEMRVPFLNSALIDFSWSIPLTSKINGFDGKLPLKCLLHRYLPTELFERPKQGFSIPLGQWLRGPLREWSEDLLASESLRSDPYLDSQYVHNLWRSHVDGSDCQYYLWNILMYISWRHKWL